MNVPEIRVVSIEDHDDGTCTLHLYIDDDLYEELLGYAERDGLTFNEWFVEALRLSALMCLESRKEKTESNA